MDHDTSTIALHASPLSLCCCFCLFVYAYLPFGALFFVFVIEYVYLVFSSERLWEWAAWNFFFVWTGDYSLLFLILFLVVVRAMRLRPAIALHQLATNYLFLLVIKPINLGSYF